MSTIALIGPDGAGKTTHTRRLAASGLPLRYLYMGVAAASSDLALPTSRLAERVRERRPRRGAAARAWAAARLANRLADAAFRQLVSWSLQARGKVVLYDRHYLLDYAPEVAARPGDPLDRRLFRRLLPLAVRAPDLVLFLDAPGEVLFARKGELSPEELERRRQAFLRAGERVRGFVRVDATRPAEEVYAEVARLVGEFCRARARGAPAALRAGEVGP